MEWDQAVAMHGLFNPLWNGCTAGTSVSLVADCQMHTKSMMVGVSFPDSRKVRIYGDINSQVKGCRRLTLLDLVVESMADFSHLASVEWKEPLASLHQSCHPGVPVFVQDITAPSCVKHLLQQLEH